MRSARYRFSLPSLNSLWLVVNLRTLVVAVIAITSTWLCITFDIVANFPMSLVVTAVVFPVVFAINGAYERREQVLQGYAELKAYGRAIYFASRDWLEQPDLQSLARLQGLLRNLLQGCADLLSDDSANLARNEHHVYSAFSALSIFIRAEQRHRGLSPTEVSRCNQYLSNMMGAFEKIKHIYQYRTPRTLKAFSDFFILLLPPLFGPMFAFMENSYTTPGLEYAMPVTFAVVLTALSNIQEQLENPFDKFGEDDVSFNVDKFLASLEYGDPPAPG